MVPENAVISLNLADVAQAVVNHDTVFDKVAQIIVKWNGSRRYGLSKDTPQVFAKEILTGLQLNFQMPSKICMSCKDLLELFTYSFLQPVTWKLLLMETSKWSQEALINLNSWSLSLLWVRKKCIFSKSAILLFVFCDWS